ncbi:MAG: hypothetical protein PHT48_07730 [Dechloromonas sp.]|nr:hypothetical protein [Dechloromonas sp.]
MSINKVFFTSRKLAESLEGNPYMAVISITDPTTPEARLDPLFRHVLRLSFFDALPADEYQPPLPGLFDRKLARQISDFVQEIHQAPFQMSMMVHCEYGISRSAAVALFVASFADAPLEAQEFTYEANPWVVDTLQALHPQLNIDIPSPDGACDRRTALRA